MKLLLFEWLSGGGLGPLPDGAFDANSSMMRQGREMLIAVCEDFLEAGVDVVLPLDKRIIGLVPDFAGAEKVGIGDADDLENRLVEIAGDVDVIMLIAPETDCCLSTCIDWLQPFHSKLISPGQEFAKLASNKQATFDYLSAQRFDSYPQGIDFEKYWSTKLPVFPLPAVLKPNDGAGSEEVRLITDWGDFERLASDQKPDFKNHQYRLEEFISGTAVSVSIICGPEQNYVLAPTVQIFDQKPFGHYVESGYPVESAIADRAIQLAIQAVSAMPPTQGYIGMDIVISDESSQHDSLIEINPRLTMSYLKLRQIYNDNLAKLILDQAEVLPENEAQPSRCIFRQPNF